MRRAPVPLLLLAALAGCGMRRPPEQDPGREPPAVLVAPVPEPAAAPPELVEVAPPPPAPAGALLPDRFIDHLVTRCLIDELGPSEYTSTWLAYGLGRRSLPPGSVFPGPGRIFPAESSPQAQREARALRRKWLARPESHVVDCSFTIARRTCSTCGSPAGAQASQTVHYVAYLPAALSRDPGSVRSLLLLVPGGNGGRSRAFLSPIPGVTARNKGCGGLEARRRVDEWASAHPGATPPIVVALESGGDEYVNGATETLTHDLPGHVADVFLGGATGIAVGAEGVSSGAALVARALFAKPEAFRSVGLSCMACGAIDPRDHRMAPRTELEAWARALKTRADAGLFDLRFAIGARDGQLPCNQELYGIFARAGIFEADRRPELVGCAPGEPDASGGCRLVEDGFITYAGELHDYAFLARSFPDQLAFHLGALTGASPRPSSQAPAVPAPAAPEAPERIIAIGDLHGDLAATRDVLRLAGLTDEEDRWRGGRTQVVQLGDILDRGDGEREILDLLARLDAEARAAGGRVHVLLGNHEIMNAAGRFLYVTHGGFAAFEGLEGFDPRAPDLAHLPRERRARAFALRPGGPWARRLAEYPVTLAIGDNVFAHGAVLPAHIDYGLDRIDREAAAFLRGDLEAGEQRRVWGFFANWDSPVQSRLYSRRPDPGACHVLGDALTRLGKRRMIVAHTPQPNGITSACGERVWSVDANLSAWGGSRREVLEIRGDLLRVIAR